MYDHRGHYDSLYRVSFEPKRWPWMLVRSNRTMKGSEETGQIIWSCSLVYLCLQARKNLIGYYHGYFACLLPWLFLWSPFSTDLAADLLSLIKWITQSLNWNRCFLRSNMLILLFRSRFLIFIEETAKAKRDRNNWVIFIFPLPGKFASTINIIQCFEHWNKQ